MENMTENKELAKKLGMEILAKLPKERLNKAACEQVHY
jgi:hypothetical protein